MNVTVVAAPTVLTVSIASVASPAGAQPTVRLTESSQSVADGSRSASERAAPLGAAALEAQARSLGVLVGRPTIRPMRTDTPPLVDGRLDDAVWQSAVKITSFVQYEPVDGAPPTEPTDMYVAYDDDHLYFGFYAYYADPRIMRSNRGRSRYGVQ